MNLCSALDNCAAAMVGTALVFLASTLSALRRYASSTSGRRPRKYPSGMSSWPMLPSVLILAQVSWGEGMARVWKVPSGFFTPDLKEPYFPAYQSGSLMRAFFSPTMLKVWRTMNSRFCTVKCGCRCGLLGSPVDPSPETLHTVSLYLELLPGSVLFL